MEERKDLVKEILRKMLSRQVRLKGVEEKKGEAERWVLIMTMEEIADKKEILDRDEKIERF